MTLGPASDTPGRAASTAPGFGDATAPGGPAHPLSRPPSGVADDPVAAWLVAGAGALVAAPGVAAAPDSGWLTVPDGAPGGAAMLFLRPGEAALPLHPDRPEGIAAALDAAAATLDAVERLLGLPIEPGAWRATLPPAVSRAAVAAAPPPRVESPTGAAAETAAAADAATLSVSLAWPDGGLVARRLADAATRVAEAEGRAALALLGDSVVAVTLAVDIAAADPAALAALGPGDWIIAADPPWAVRLTAPLVRLTRDAWWDGTGFRPTDAPSPPDAARAPDALAITARWDAALPASALPASALLGGALPSTRPALAWPPADAPIDVRVAGRTVARGRALRIGERAGVVIETLVADADEGASRP